MKNSKKIVVSILFLILMSCGGGGSSDGNTNSIPSVPNQTNDPFVWETVNPEDVGLDSVKIQSALDYALQEGGLTQSLVIIKDGKIVGQAYRGMTSNEANALSAGLNDTPAQLLLDWYGARDMYSLATSWSTAKSFTSILIGIAIDQGLIGSINESASNYLTEWQGDNREFITIRNLLDMRSTLTPTCGDRTTTSLYPCQAWASSGGALVYADDQLSACIQAQVADSGNQPWYNGEWQPGNFYYSNCDTQLLGEILFRATGQDPFTYASTHLFSKLNMNAFWWRDNTEVGQANGNYLTYCCLDATTSDFAKFGQMILNGGELGGQRIVSQNYIDMIKNITMDSNVGNFSYGLKFWTISTSNVLNSAGESTAFPPANTIYSTIGFDGQYIAIDFENNMIIARNSFYHPIENISTDRKMKLTYGFLEQSNWTATVPAGLGSNYNSPTGNTFSIQQLLLKVNESLK